MYASFFTAAAQSRTRQIGFRALVAFHLILLTLTLSLVQPSVGGPSGAGTIQPARGMGMVGVVMLIAGIVEGALILGWRLTQMPKTRALEFLLASPLHPGRIFLTESAIGLLRLSLVTLSGLPIYLFRIVNNGDLDLFDLWPLLTMPLLWGWLTGLMLTGWAYDPEWLRKYKERFLIGLVLVYLVVGVLAAENLGVWLRSLSPWLRDWILSWVLAIHLGNPFAVMGFWFAKSPLVMWDNFVLIQMLAGIGIVWMLIQCSWRFKGHYQERHFRPIFDKSGRKRPAVPDQPLTWWAIKRVTEYSGAINLWLAGGFGVLYAAHTVAGDAWPPWMGRQVFVVFDRFFGLPAVATALVVLSAVPAAFQYGLWDSNTQDRCRRLELLLLTDLEARDYWTAALRAAWHRGSGYFAVALVLWLAGAVSGQSEVKGVIAGLCGSVILWLFYFTLGFRAFAGGMQANNLGLLLSAIVPLSTIALFQAGMAPLAALTPPGAIYALSLQIQTVPALVGILAMGLTTLCLYRQALSRCLNELRAWYGKYHGQKVA